MFWALEGSGEFFFKISDPPVSLIDLTVISCHTASGLPRILRHDVVTGLSMSGRDVHLNTACPLSSHLFDN